jgi:phage anti-repressor protein
MKTKFIKIINTTKVKNIINKLSDVRIEMNNKTEFKNLTLCLEHRFYLNLDNKYSENQWNIEDIIAFLRNKDYIVYDKNINLFKIQRNFRAFKVNEMFNSEYAAPKYLAFLTDIYIKHENINYRVVSVFDKNEQHQAVLIEEKYINLFDKRYITLETNDKLDFVTIRSQGEKIALLLAMTHIKGYSIIEYIKTYLSI